MSAFVAKLGSLFAIALCGWIGWLVGSKRSELVAEPTGNRSAPHRSVNGASDALPAEDFQELLDSAPVEAFPEILAAISNLPNYQRRHIRPIAVETWARLDPAAAFAFAQAREDDWDSYAMKARIVEQWGPSGMEVINRLVEQEGIRPNLALSAIERCAVEQPEAAAAALLEFLRSGSGKSVGRNQILEVFYKIAETDMELSLATAREAGAGWHEYYLRRKAGATTVESAVAFADQGNIVATRWALDVLARIDAAAAAEALNEVRSLWETKFSGESVDRDLDMVSREIDFRREIQTAMSNPVKALSARDTGRKLKKDIAIQWLRDDQQAATEFLLGLPDSKFSNYLESLGDVVATLNDEDLARVIEISAKEMVGGFNDDVPLERNIELLGQKPYLVRHQTFLDGIAAQWGESNPLQGLEWIDGLDEASQEGARRSLYETWAYEAPEEFEAMLANIEPSSLHADALAFCGDYSFPNPSENTIRAARHWFDGLDEQARSDWLRKQLELEHTVYLSQFREELLVELQGNEVLEDDNARWGEISSIVHDWAENDLLAARTFLKSATLPPLTDEVIDLTIALFIETGTPFAVQDFDLMEGVTDGVEFTRDYPPSERMVLLGEWAEALGASETNEVEAETAAMILMQDDELTSAARGDLLQRFDRAKASRLATN